MAAGIYSFTIEQGSTWDQYLNIVSSDSKPVDLSQYTASMQIRSTNTKAGTLYATVTCSIEPTSGSEDDQGDPVSGSVKLLLQDLLYLQKIMVFYQDQSVKKWNLG